MEAAVLSAISILNMQEGVPNPARMFFTGPFLLFWCALIVVVLAGLWKLFVKAGYPGWACLIPIYNVYIMLKIAGRPGWWLLLFFIPLVNLIIQIVVAIDIAKAFGQGAAFGFFLNFLLCGIGYLILGFGNYQYLGPQTQAMTARA
jgi:uncharacterized membrane protein YhaH (DUF805 family)